MRTLEQLKQVLQSQAKLLWQEYGIAEMGLFGSYVTGECTESSDVDILVDFHKAVDLLTFVRLKNVLSDLLGAPVDLVMKKGLTPSIGKRILEQVVYLYQEKQR